MTPLDGIKYFRRDSAPARAVTIFLRKHRLQSMLRKHSFILKYFKPSKRERIIRMIETLLVENVRSWAARGVHSMGLRHPTQNYQMSYREAKRRGLV